MKPLSKAIRDNILGFQNNEITENFIYDKLSQSTKDLHNKKVLKRISDDEKRHYNFWKSLTNEDVSPRKLSIWKYLLITKLFGLTFGIKLMENGEESAQSAYKGIKLPGVRL